MKTVQNQSPKACAKLMLEAEKLGIKAEIIQRSKPRSRRNDGLGTTFVPQKVMLIDDLRMSLGQAKGYLKARGYEKHISNIDDRGAFLVTWTERETFVDHYHAFDNYKEALTFFNENNTDAIRSIHLTHTIKSSDYDGITID